MKVLVLGGTGLFGRKTALHLLQDKDVSLVVAMDVNPPKEWMLKSIDKYKDRFRFVRGDVGELEDIVNAIKNYSIDRLVNWAFLLPGDVERSPRLSVKVNALGMCNSFEAARLCGITRVVYASSEGVYGPQDEYGDRDVVESDPMHPGSGYALMKQFAEILAAQYTQQTDIKFSALRPTIGYGHGGLTPIVVRQFGEIISLPAVGKPFSVDADGTSTSSLASADDIGTLTRLLIKAPSSPHPAYNVGGPPTSLQDVAKVVRKYFPDAKITFGKQAPPADRGKRGIPWKVSSELAKADFGFSLLPLEESVLTIANDARLEAGLPSIAK
ncbi:MAG TPA: NAD(P)-dependent oxidoreductase [Dehalococcoidales bacterium]|nr:NAD(P)-dependent oxidoreductase [Dehalococcoidales bacterium]